MCVCLLALLRAINQFDFVFPFKGDRNCLWFTILMLNSHNLKVFIICSGTFAEKVFEYFKSLESWD